MKRVFLIVLDSFGIGAMPDAPAFGDVGGKHPGLLRHLPQALHSQYAESRSWQH